MLVLPAELTSDQAPACSRMLAQAMRADASPVIVADAQAVVKFDSGALAVLLDARRNALSLGKNFAVAHMPPRLRELAAVYGVAELLHPP